MKCDKCQKEVNNLLPLIRDDDETLMICNNCWGYEDARADYEYERQKEEGWFNDPDKERDIKEDR